MSDLVNSLRSDANWLRAFGVELGSLAHQQITRHLMEAADEIERLRGELHEMERSEALASIGWFGTPKEQKPDEPPDSAAPTP